MIKLNIRKNKHLANILSETYTSRHRDNAAKVSKILEVQPEFSTMKPSEWIYEDILKIYDKLDDINKEFRTSTMAFLIYNEEDKSLRLISKSLLFTKPEVRRGLINNCKEVINNPTSDPFSEETVIREDLRSLLKGTKYTCMIYLFYIDVLGKQYVEFAAESDIKNSKEYLLSILEKGVNE